MLKKLPVSNNNCMIVSPVANAAFLFVLLLTLSNTVFGATIPERINFQNIVENKDFSMGEGAAFLQDSQGFMWLGGRVALIRYDGYEFKQIDYIADENTPHEKHHANGVNHIYEDSHQTLWIASRVGVLRYDPRTETLIHVKDDQNQALKISAHEIFRIQELPSGEILASSGAGLFVLDRHTNRYETITPDEKRQHWLSVPLIRSMYLAPNGTLWLGTEAGLEQVNWKEKKFSPVRFNPDEPESTLNALVKEVRDIVEDGDGKLWLATKNGLVHVDPTTYQGTRYANDPKDSYSLGGNDVWKLLIDSEGLLWVASDGGGVSVYDQEKNRFVNYQAELGREGALNTNKVRTVYEDRNGDIWVGNYPVGVNFYDRSTAPITTYTAIAANPNSLSNTSVLSVSEDKNGNLWLGTDGGGLNFFDRERNEFTHFKSDPNDPATLNGDSVLSTFIDSNGLVWIGTWGKGLASYNPTEKKFTRYPFSDNPSITASGQPSATLNTPYVWSIKEDKNHNLWIGTHTGGVSKFNPQTKLFTNYKNIANDPTSLTYNLVWTTLEDSRGGIWVATANGLNLMNPSKGTFTAFSANSQDPNALSNSNIFSIYEDRKQWLWIGTDSGLNLYDRETNKFTPYTKKSGFFDDSIRDIIEDNDGLMWVSTNNGFSSLNPDTKKIKNYTRIGGRLVGGFGMHSGALSSRGEVIFGGAEGLRIFNPKEMRENRKSPPIVLTDFKIFSDSVIPGASDGILRNVINHTNSVTLDHTKSMFTFSFAALNYRDTEKNQYSYKLEGFDNDWIQAGNQRNAKYTNLDAGTYVFRVKGSNNDGVWNEQGRSVKITILPAPWASPFAYLFYALTIMLFVARIMQVQRKKLKEARKKIAMERALNEKMKNLDALKEHFLANTSHELRTPLNGIIGLAESISVNEDDSPSDTKEKARMILRSGKRLSNLVDDILEFSQLASNELALTLTNNNLRALTEVVLAGLQDRINDKSLQVFNNIPANTIVHSDETRLKQILYRLLDNAIKFTRAGTITISYAQNDNFDSISITDTGIGIAPNNISAIFTAFQQVEGSAKRMAEGAGLGLSVVQKLIALHKGELKVTSVMGQGSTFSFTLPRCTTRAETTFLENSEINIMGSALPNDESTSHVNNNTATKNKIGNKGITSTIEKTHAVQKVYFNGQWYSDESTVPSLTTPHERFKILVVDDDPVNRMVIKAHLRKQHFQTVEAIDGEDALKVMAEHRDIDLIILDVMMPAMTGYELCEALRKQVGLHELPVIFLTANHQASEALKAFVAGGNDFMTKPVAGKLLLDKVNAHLSLLEESRIIDKSFKLQKTAHLQAGVGNEALQTPLTINKQKHLEFSKALANIVEHIYNLIAPIESIGCWIINEHNLFEMIDSTSESPLNEKTPPISLEEINTFMDHTGSENRDLWLCSKIEEAAAAGRLGSPFEYATFLHCEPLSINHIVLGFLVLGGNSPDFRLTEHRVTLHQCKAHMTIAFVRAKYYAIGDTST